MLRHPARIVAIVAKKGKERRRETVEEGYSLKLGVYPVKHRDVLRCDLHHKSLLLCKVV